jgi:large exoprotein involved in heme utilization and adhesion
VNESPIRIPESEINASSEAGIAGNISIDSPDIGVEETPELPLSGTTIWQDLSPYEQIPDEVATRESVVQSPVPSSSELPNAPIIEAQGWRHHANGQTELIAQAPTVLPHEVGEMGVDEMGDRCF